MRHGLAPLVAALVVGAGALGRPGPADMHICVCVCIYGGGYISAEGDGAVYKYVLWLANWCVFVCGCGPDELVAAFGELLATTATSCRRLRADRKV